MLSIFTLYTNTQILHLLQHYFIISYNRFEPFSKEDGKKTVSVTAVSFAPIPVTTTEGQKSAVLAVGLECGLIELWTMSLEDDTSSNNNSSSSSNSSKVDLLKCFSASDCHIAAVKKLAWRPRNHNRDKNETKLTLASCGLDHGVRIFDVFFK